eukprot:COSAG02_NODE_2478_length_8730_cov_2.636079_2_plen_117_part_00
MDGVASATAWPTVAARPVPTASISEKEQEQPPPPPVPARETGTPTEGMIPDAAAEERAMSRSGAGGEAAQGEGELSETAAKTLKDAKDMLPPCLVGLLNPKYIKDTPVSSCTVPLP